MCAYSAGFENNGMRISYYNSCICALLRRNKIKTTINDLCSNIETWLNAEENLNKIMDGLAKGSQQLEMLKAAAAHPQHPLYSLHSRYQSQKDASDAMINAQIGLKQKIEECDTQLAQYKVNVG